MLEQNGVKKATMWGVGNPHRMSEQRRYLKRGHASMSVILSRMRTSVTRRMQGEVKKAFVEGRR
jgi:hypothetical protein